MDEKTKYLPRRLFKFRELDYQLVLSAHQPFIGVTQGGSSRKWPGCKVAATDGEFRPEPEETK